MFKQNINISSVDFPEADWKVLNFRSGNTHTCAQTYNTLTRRLSKCCIIQEKQGAQMEKGEKERKKEGQSSLMCSSNLIAVSTSYSYQSRKVRWNF